jgi:hypothetical protein
MKDENTAVAEFKYYDWQPKDAPDGDDRYYYHAFIDDIVSAYLDVYVTDGEITDTTLHIEWNSGIKRIHDTTARDFIGNEFELPEYVKLDVRKRIAWHSKEVAK